MNVQNDFAAIAALDLDPIKVKLMHAESGEGWSLEKANAVEFEYRRFLYLMKKFPLERTAPLFDVDTFWHYHILDTLKYAQDCEQVFGYFLHHFPYIGLRGEDDEKAHQRVGERMKELYEQTFGEPYVREGGAPGAAWSGVAGSPVAARTAWSGVAGSPVAARTAWSGVAGAPVAARSAWSGVAGSPGAARSAWSGVVDPLAAAAPASERDPSPGPVDDFYRSRPSLPLNHTA